MTINFQGKGDKGDKKKERTAGLELKQNKGFFNKGNQTMFRVK